MLADVTSTLHQIELKVGLCHHCGDFDLQGLLALLATPTWCGHALHRSEVVQDEKIALVRVC